MVWIVVPCWGSSRGLRIWVLAWVVVSTVSSHGVTRSLIVVLTSTSSEILSRIDWNIDVYMDTVCLWQNLSSSVMQVHGVWLVIRIVVPSWSSSRGLRIWVLAWVVVSTISSHGVTRSLIVVSSASQRNLGLSCWHIHINIYRNSIRNQILIDGRK